MDSAKLKSQREINDAIQRAVNSTGNEQRNLKLEILNTRKGEESLGTLWRKALNEILDNDPGHPSSIDGDGNLVLHCRKQQAFDDGRAVEIAPELLKTEMGFSMRTTTKVTPKNTGKSLEEPLIDLYKDRAIDPTLKAEREIIIDPAQKNFATRLEVALATKRMAKLEDQNPSAGSAARRERYNSVKRNAKSSVWGDFAGLEFPPHS